MRFSGRHRWRFGAGVLLALLACATFAPQAHAGCGEPSIVTWPADGKSHRAEAEPSSHVPAHSSPHSSLPGPRPCTGPHCSRTPLAPPPPPATVSASSQEWACLPALSDAADPHGIAHRLEGDLFKPIFRAFRIYYPPR